MSPNSLISATSSGVVPAGGLLGGADGLCAEATVLPAVVAPALDPEATGGDGVLGICTRDPGGTTGEGAADLRAREPGADAGEGVLEVGTSDPEAAIGEGVVYLSLRVLLSGVTGEIRPGVRVREGEGDGEDEDEGRNSGVRGR